MTTLFLRRLALRNTTGEWQTSLSIIEGMMNSVKWRDIAIAEMELYPNRDEERSTWKSEPQF